ncbi:MAG: 3-beta hydroxysteroid dehydrogenase [Microbacterium sp. SCN 70-200]|uniref:SDR family oxidoreductase n=1 Tax=unclassified Microbacterium TaxID=2609290 RepID=UPI00086DD6AE|nr:MULTISPECIES: SDR family oxidoreductase [unclassified Microbacterium]MBN9214409.1 SDR family oxidoreductase [Microbacterium sp.]ODT40792.1 MAG: 3-beta hydroxysteroid dehydrogenase [Microbacterium sp. SCN 70-200]OJV83791.1 MAG: 3-beta hydroxysteroid dehydrogenase [Microbacterium sp. 70-16]
MKLVVAGGTGVLGSLVVAEAQARGHDVVVLSRSLGFDLTGDVAPVTATIAGADAVIDVTSTSTLKAEACVAFFEAVTATLLSAEAAAGVPHHIALSIVGVDRAPYGYYAGKRAQERAVEAGPVPWTILRATQFHEFSRQMYANAKIGPVHVAPRMRTQPIAAREVATRLIDLAEAPAHTGYVEIAGPREESLVAMIRAWARASGIRGWIPAISLPGPFGRAQRAGTVLPGPGVETSTETFAEWLSRTTR